MEDERDFRRLRLPTEDAQKPSDSGSAAGVSPKVESAPAVPKAEEATRSQTEKKEEEVPEHPAAKKVFAWTKLLVGGGTVLVGLLGSQYGIWIALALVIIMIIAFFYFKAMYNNWKFEQAKTKAGSKVGSEASDNQGRLNDNRDKIDDFLGREKRS